MEPMNYTLGRGELYFNMFKAGTQSGIGERYLGNTPAVSTTASVQNLDHYNSDRGVKEKDASIALQTDRTGSFTTDHIAPANLALFYFGSTSALSQTALTDVVETFDGVTPGYFYQLGESVTNPTGVRTLDTVTVTDGATGTPITYVEGTDYNVNKDLGRVEVISGGGIAADSKIEVTYTTKASTRSVILSGSMSVEGALRYVANNPKGDDLDHFWPWVKITPNGDFALKGDDWQAIPFNIEILRKTGYEAVYISGRATAS